MTRWKNSRKRRRMDRSVIPPDESVIERPDEHLAGSANELYCWLDDPRECGADCVAFEEGSLTDPRMTTCKVMNAIRSVALSFAQISKAMLQGGRRQAAADMREKLEEISTPPKVSP